jgi:nucleoside phosphorylase
MFDTSPEPILPRFTAVILTALETEYKAVRDLLVETKVIVGPSGRDYREGRFHRRPDGTGDHAPWRVLIHEGGRDQMNALRATEDSARDWPPDAILFVGVAGGRPGKARHFEVLVSREIIYPIFADSTS